LDRIMKQRPGGIVIEAKHGVAERIRRQLITLPRRRDPAARGRYSNPIRFGGQYVAKALPMIQSRGTGPQKRLSSDEPRLSPIMK
jgi:hypothetical protein